jgi:hypothetical protein
MTKDSTYQVARLEVSDPSLRSVAVGSEGVFQLTDVNWRLMFRDPKRGLSCGLLRSQLQVEPMDRRTCRVSISDDSSEGFNGSVILNAPAERVQFDLHRRLVSLGHSGEVIAAVGKGEWWRYAQIFDRFNWSHRCSIAGVRYRAGWWGTGKIKPSMLAKVLDFGPRGVALRGWWTQFVIPWDAIASITVSAGDGWSLANGAEAAHRRRIGTSVLVRSQAGQDAVFFTPLLSPSEVGDLLAPLTTQLETAELDRQLRRTGLWRGPYASAPVPGGSGGSAAIVDNQGFPELG